MAWTTLFTDAFTGANGTSLPTHDATWSNLSGTGEIQSNAMADGNSGSGSRSEVNLTTEDDQAVEAVLAEGGGATCYLFARHTSTGSGLLDFSGYAAYLAGGTFIVFSRYDSGSETNLNFDGGGYSQGDVLRLECEGTTIRVLKNDVEVFSETDATYSSGKCALATEATGGGWDDLVVEHVVVASGIPRLLRSSLLRGGAIIGGRLTG